MEVLIKNLGKSRKGEKKLGKYKIKTETRIRVLRELSDSLR